LIDTLTEGDFFIWMETFRRAVAFFQQCLSEVIAVKTGILSFVAVVFMQFLFVLVVFSSKPMVVMGKVISANFVPRKTPRVWRAADGISLQSATAPSRHSCSLQQKYSALSRTTMRKTLGKKVEAGDYRAAGWSRTSPALTSGTPAAEWLMTLVPV